jgi:hypothetical protein
MTPIIFCKILFGCHSEVDDTPGRKVALLDAGAVISLPMLFLHGNVLLYLYFILFMHVFCSKKILFMHALMAFILIVLSTLMMLKFVLSKIYQDIIY